MTQKFKPLNHDLLELMPLAALRLNSKVTLYIVDDSLIIREHLVMMLSEMPRIEVVGQAESVSEAIRGIGELQPDVVILDIRMPDGSGLEVLQAIKQGERAPVVIMLTNYPYPAYREKCLQAGADYFLDKSTEFDQIPDLFEGHRQDKGS